MSTKKCTSCGSEYDESCRFCPSCGAPASTNDQPQNQAQAAQQQGVVGPAQPFKPSPILVCPRCGGTNIQSQVFQENQGSITSSQTNTKMRTGGHGCLWWLLIGWWWKVIDFFIWLFAFPVRLIIHLMAGRKTSAASTTVASTHNRIMYRTVYMCKTCGHHWEV